MNKQNLLAVADIIEQYPNHFDMGAWCGTTACIAGWAYVLNHGGHDPAAIPNPATPALDDIEGWHRLSDLNELIRHEATEFLGINSTEAAGLFFDDEWPSEYIEFEEYKGAINLLRDLATGVTSFSDFPIYQD